MNLHGLELKYNKLIESIGKNMFRAFSSSTGDCNLLECKSVEFQILLFIIALNKAMPDTSRFMTKLKKRRAMNVKRGRREIDERAAGERRR